jgi:hypothetical protein
VKVDAIQQRPRNPLPVVLDLAERAAALLGRNFPRISPVTAWVWVSF